MKQAAAAGLRSANGWGMLVEQALLSFEIWTTKKIDRAAFNTAWREYTQTP
jgi:shikimate 5-dehydrogenase